MLSVRNCNVNSHRNLMKDIKCRVLDGVHSSSLSSVLLLIPLRPLGNKRRQLSSLLLHGFLLLLPKLDFCYFFCVSQLQKLVCTWNLHLVPSGLHYDLPSVINKVLCVGGTNLFSPPRSGVFPSTPRVYLPPTSVDCFTDWLESGPGRGNHAECFARDPSAGRQHYYWQGWEGTSEKHCVRLIGFPLNKKNEIICSLPSRRLMD